MIGGDLRSCIDKTLQVLFRPKPGNKVFIEKGIVYLHDSQAVGEPNSAPVSSKDVSCQKIGHNVSAEIIQQFLFLIIFYVK